MSNHLTIRYAGQSLNKTLRNHITHIPFNKDENQLKEQYVRRTLTDTQLGKKSVLRKTNGSNSSGTDETRHDGSARSSYDEEEEPNLPVHLKSKPPVKPQIVGPR